MCKFVGLNVNRIEKGNKYDSRCESNKISGRTEIFPCLP